MITTTERFEGDGLTVLVTFRPTEVQMIWQGVSDTREPGRELGPFLQRMVGVIRDRPITIDFRQLEYVNSATVSPILQFVKSLDVESQAVTLVYDTNVFWQRAQYRCMRAIAFQLKHVKVADTV